MNALPERVESSGTVLHFPDEIMDMVCGQNVLRFDPMFGMSDEQYARFTTSAVRRMSKLGRK